MLAHVLLAVLASVTLRVHALRCADAQARAGTRVLRVSKVQQERWGFTRADLGRYWKRSVVTDYCAYTPHKAIPRCSSYSRPGEQRKSPVELPIVTVNVYLVKQQVIPYVALRAQTCQQHRAVKLEAPRTGWAWMQHQMPA